jgi:hypothetical protein
MDHVSRLLFRLKQICFRFPSRLTVLALDANHVGLSEHLLHGIAGSTNAPPIPPTREHTYIPKLTLPFFSR